MGKKAVIGTSPKDSSIDKMDRFIQREERKEQDNHRKFGKRKDWSKVAFDEWPLDKRLHYLENMTAVEKFNEKYTSYSTWYDAVKKKSGVYPNTFIDWTSRADVKLAMREMFSKATSVKDAVDILKREHGIY